MNTVIVILLLNFIAAMIGWNISNSWYGWAAYWIAVFVVNCIIHFNTLVKIGTPKQ